MSISQHISSTDNQQQKEVDAIYDVVVVGGGPAGSTVATLLAMWKHKVLVLEKEHFPRHHIGESLLAGTTQLMKQMNVYDKVEQAGFVHKYGATYIWGKSEEPWSIFFSEVSDEDRYSFQVERSRFDKILLDHAQEIGATVKEGCRLTEFIYEQERVVGARYIDDEHITHTVSCQFCVDATGQSAFLGNALKLRTFNKALRNFALYAYYQGGKSAVEIVSSLRPQDQGNIFVAAIDKGWIWYIPLGNKRYSVGVVTQANYAQEFSKEKRFAFYQECLQASPQMRYLLSEAQIESTSLYTQSDWSYVCNSFQGPGYILVGDAACFVDPILSTGVDLAMEGAFKAARAINTAFSQPHLATNAMQWYEEEYKAKAKHFLHMAEHWYYGHRTQDDWFWKAKSLVDPNSNLSVRQAFILLSGGFTTGAGDQNLPALQPLGGFRPFQLRTMYSHFDNSQVDPYVLETTQRTLVADTLRDVQDLLVERCIRFKDGISYRLSMLEQDSLLVPVMQILQESTGMPYVLLLLPVDSQPLLESINGKQTFKEIVDGFVAASTSSEMPDHCEKVKKQLETLYLQDLIEIA